MFGYSFSYSGPLGFLRLWLFHPQTAWGLLIFNGPVENVEGKDVPKVGASLMWDIFCGRTDVHIHDE